MKLVSGLRSFGGRDARAEADRGDETELRKLLRVLLHPAVRNTDDVERPVL